MANTLTPIVAIHMTAAILAIATGPIAIWARKSATLRPRLHRAFGYGWVTLMLVAATSAIFIRSELPSHWYGFSLIHLLVIVVYAMLVIAFRFLIKGNIRGHRLTMVNLYIGACLVAGAFTLTPNRYLGNLLFNQWLGLV
jgi:uncharacterized membrane protein